MKVKNAKEIKIPQISPRDNPTSLFPGSDSDDINFIGFQKAKRNRVGFVERDHYMDDTLSSIHLQLSSSGTGHSHSERQTTNTPKQNSQSNFNSRNQNNNHTNRNDIFNDANTDTTIIIQPIETIRSEFFSSSVKLFRILQSSPFQTAKIIQSRTNINKGIQIITIEDKSKMTELLKIQSAGTGKVFSKKSSIFHFVRSKIHVNICLLYTSPSPRDKRQSRMPSSA